MDQTKTQEFKAALQQLMMEYDVGLFAGGYDVDHLRFRSTDGFIVLNVTDLAMKRS